MNTTAKESRRKQWWQYKAHEARRRVTPNSEHNL
jgi:hypothetical protein